MMVMAVMTGMMLSVLDGDGGDDRDDAERAGERADVTTDGDDNDEDRDRDLAMTATMTHGHADDSEHLFPTERLREHMSSAPL